MIEHTHQLSTPASFFEKYKHMDIGVSPSQQLTHHEIYDELHAFYYWLFSTLAIEEYEKPIFEAISWIEQVLKDKNDALVLITIYRAVSQDDDLLKRFIHFVKSDTSEEQITLAGLLANRLLSQPVLPYPQECARKETLRLMISRFMTPDQTWDYLLLHTIKKSWMEYLPELNEETKALPSSFPNTHCFFTSPLSIVRAIESALHAILFQKDSSETLSDAALMSLKQFFPDTHWEPNTQYDKRKIRQCIFEYLIQAGHLLLKPMEGTEILTQKPSLFEIACPLNSIEDVLDWTSFLHASGCQEASLFEFVSTFFNTKGTKIHLSHLWKEVPSDHVLYSLLLSWGIPLSKDGTNLFSSKVSVEHDISISGKFLASDLWLKHRTHQFSLKNDVGEGLFLLACIFEKTPEPLFTRYLPEMATIATNIQLMDLLQHSTRNINLHQFLLTLNRQKIRLVLLIEAMLKDQPTTLEQLLNYLKIINLFPSYLSLEDALLSIQEDPRTIAALLFPYLLKANHVHVLSSERGSQFFFRHGPSDFLKWFVEEKCLNCTDQKLVEETVFRGARLLQYYQPELLLFFLERLPDHFLRPLLCHQISDSNPSSFLRYIWDHTDAIRKELLPWLTKKAPDLLDMLFKNHNESFSILRYTRLDHASYQAMIDSAISIYSKEQLIQILSDVHKRYGTVLTRIVLEQLRVFLSLKGFLKSLPSEQFEHLLKAENSAFMQSLIQAPIPIDDFHDLLSDWETFSVETQDTLLYATNPSLWVIAAMDRPCMLMQLLQWSSQRAQHGDSARHRRASFFREHLPSVIQALYDHVSYRNNEENEIINAFFSEALNDTLLLPCLLSNIDASVLTEHHALQYIQLISESPLRHMKSLRLYKQERSPFFWVKMLLQQFAPPHFLLSKRQAIFESLKPFCIIPEISNAILTNHEHFSSLWLFLNLRSDAASIYESMQLTQMLQTLANQEPSSAALQDAFYQVANAGDLEMMQRMWQILPPHQITSLLMSDPERAKALCQHAEEKRRAWWMSFFPKTHEKEPPGREIQSFNDLLGHLSSPDIAETTKQQIIDTIYHIPFIRDRLYNFANYFKLISHPQLTETHRTALLELHQGIQIQVPELIQLLSSPALTERHRSEILAPGAPVLSRIMEHYQTRRHDFLKDRAHARPLSPAVMHHALYEQSEKEKKAEFENELNQEISTILSDLLRIPLLTHAHRLAIFCALKMSLSETGIVGVFQAFLSSTGKYAGEHVVREFLCSEQLSAHCQGSIHAACESLLAGNTLSSSFIEHPLASIADDVHPPQSMRIM